MAGYQNLNPLDYMFYVGDVLRRRVGMPGVNILLLLELGGRLDVEGFNQAVRGMHRLYPATTASLHRSKIIGKPRWLLGRRCDDPAQWLEIRAAESTQGESLHQHAEDLLHTPLDCTSKPPVQFVLLRGHSGTDALAMRWPHFFMDARGGMILLEELQRLYEEQVDPETLESLGDENREDVEEMLRSMKRPARMRAVIGGSGAAQPSDGRMLRLGEGQLDYDVRNLHYVLRTLDAEQAQGVKDAALRVCGFARMGDFVRACGIQALHRTIRPAERTRNGYLTMQLVDNRKRRQRGPVCHNFFSALPVFVPASTADDRKATADLIAAATGEALSAGVITQRYAAMDQLRQLPPSVLVGLTQRGIRSGPESFLGKSLAKAPSLPMGFMGSFTRPMSIFCGAPWENVYGMGVILPHEGFGLNLTTPNDPNRLNITATYFEPNVTKGKIETFLDYFTYALGNTG